LASASVLAAEDTTSPNPQARMMLALEVSFSDSSTASFTLTDR
jgi:hypothetical protein